MYIYTWVNVNLNLFDISFLDPYFSFTEEVLIAGIIVDDYGNEWLVQLTNGREVPVYKDEVFII